MTSSSVQPLKNGSLPTTNASLNAQLTTSGTPAAYSAFARSIHDFARILLGIDATHSPLPVSPPQSQLSSFSKSSCAEALAASQAIFTRFRSYLSECNPSDLEVGGRLKCIPLICRRFFADHLAARDVHHISFA